MRRVRQMADAAANGAPARFTGFFSDRQQHLAAAALAGARAAHSFFGGYEGAERKVLCVFADTGTPPPFPICSLRLLPAGPGLSHRDYLGALLGLGLKRETIGDVRTEEGQALVFVQEAVAELILAELRQAGRVSLQVQRAGTEQPRLEAPATEEHTASLASLRADALLAAALHLNRAAAQRLFAAKLVQINHLPADTPARTLTAGDVLSVLGHGKIRFECAQATSRKNRIIVSYSVFK